MTRQAGRYASARTIGGLAVTQEERMRQIWHSRSPENHSPRAAALPGRPRGGRLVVGFAGAVLVLALTAQRARAGHDEGTIDVDRASALAQRIKGSMSEYLISQQYQYLPLYLPCKERSSEVQSKRFILL